MILGKKLLMASLLAGMSATASSVMAQSINVGTDTITIGGTASINVSYDAAGSTTIQGIKAVVDYDESIFTFDSCTPASAGTAPTCVHEADGAGTVTVSWLDFTNALPSLDPVATIEFTHTGGATTTSSLPLIADSGCSDSGGNAVACTLDDGGQIDVVAAAPVLDISPLPPIDFGDVVQNSDPAAIPVFLTNSGTADLTGLTIGTATGSFSATNVDCGATLTANGGSCQVSVDITDTSVLGALTGSFDVTSTELGTTTVDLQANITDVPPVPADIDVSPLSLTFDPANPMAQSVTISNTASGAGAQDLNVTALTLTGNFEIVAGGDCAATPFTLAPGASCTVSVAPTATAMENDTGTLVVDSDDADEPSVTVALSLATAIPIAIPTLSQWSMILVGSLLALLAMGGLRRKQG